MKKLSVFLLVLFLGACANPKIQLVSRQEIPLNEFTLAGQAKEKILVVSVKGKISDEPEPGLLFTKPSMLQEIVSQLRRAEQDDQIKALLLKIDSPGGTVTASDVLYHEIAEYKKRTGVKVVAALMNVGASGGYYIALPADRILAHPTTVTGSVGVVFFQPKVIGLFDKIGLEVDVSKSGEKKDMGSPFRPTTAEERNILQGLTDRLGKQFIAKVKTHRGMSADALNEIASARIYLADEALDLGLIDRIGYLSDAIEDARRMAGLPADARVIVYRRTEFPDDNLYNPMVTSQGGTHPSLINLGMPASATKMSTGFYYLWAPGVGDE